MAKVEMYTTAGCSYCMRAKHLLDEKGVSFTEIRVDQDPAELATMLTRSEGRRTVPQIFINDEGIGGFDELWALEKAGQLDDMLAK